MSAQRRGRVVAVAGALLMVTALAWGTSKGDLWAEGAMLLEMPWGIVILLEFYVGVLLFGAWVWTRERNRCAAAVWLLAIVVVGNLVSCLYVLTALHDAKGDAARFWLGARA